MLKGEEQYSNQEDSDDRNSQISPFNEGNSERKNFSGLLDEESYQGKKRRRTKNDVSGRDFKCGCGKTYLSYPALYTHIKEKHNGNIPDGSSKPILNKQGNRGRPKVSNIKLGK